MFGPAPPPGMNRPGTPAGQGVPAQPQPGGGQPAGTIPPTGSAQQGVPMGNPYMFMQVGPQSMSVNQISVQNIPGGGPSPPNGNNATNPGMLCNIVLYVNTAC